MKKKIVGIIVCILLIATTGITVAGTFKQAEEITMDSSQGIENTLGWGWYNPTGSWMRSDMRLVSTISSVGFGKYSFTGQYLSDDPSLWWAGVDATDLSLIVGNSVVIGKNTYESTTFAYAVNETYEVVYYATYCGINTMIGPDTSESNFTVNYYSPDQDPFGEEYPAYGSFGPYVFTYERIPIVT